MADQNSKVSPEEYRDALEGIVEIAERLKGYCGTVGELVGVVKLALENDSQLKILMALTLHPQGKR